MLNKAVSIPLAFFKSIKRKYFFFLKTVFFSNIFKIKLVCLILKNINICQKYLNYTTVFGFSPVRVFIHLEVWSLLTKSFQLNFFCKKK